MYTMEWLEGRCLLNGVGPLGSEFRVNTYTGGAPQYPCVAMNDSGNTVVAWSNYDVTGGHVGVYAQRYNRLGVPQGGEFRANTFTSDHFNWQFAYPAVAISPSGSFVVAWISPEQDGSGGGIFAQRYGASGVAQGDEFRVNTTTVGDQVFPSVAMDDSGNFIVAWRGEEADGGFFPCGIFAQRFSASGSPLGGEIHVNTYIDGEQQNPTVACDHLGNFTVAWESYAPDHRGVFAQRFNMSGVAQGGEFQVSTGGRPTTAMDSNGNFVIAWDGDDIRAQRYNAAGVPQGPDFQASTSVGASDPAIAMDRAGNFTIAWQHGDGSYSGVYAQRYDAAGTKLGGEFRVNTTTDGYQQSPAIGMGGTGNALVAWLRGGGIYAQRYGNPPTPPEFGDIPAVINVGEGKSGYTGNFYSYSFPITDLDTPQSALSYSIDNMTPPASGFGSNAFYAPNGTLMFWAGDGPFLQSVTIRVTDDTGFFDTATIVFDIANVAPQVANSPPNLNPLVGETVVFNVSAYDQYSGDSLDAWWDFGDGTVTTPQVLPSTRYDHGTDWHDTSATHVYTRPGSYIVRAFVRDDDGAVSTATFAVAVRQYGVDASGTLRVGGLPGNDTIHISPAAGGKVNLFIGGALKGVFAANSVIAYGNGGDDTLDCAENLNVPVEYHGGPGNDLLRGGMANDALFGEEGNDRIEGRSGHDILVGGTGNDRLRGVAGRDLLLAGAGFDSVYGDADDDILIAGPTSYDADLAALNNIRNEWISTKLYAVRVDNIRDGTGSADRVNGNSFFKGGSTVFDDGTEDWLCGVSGDDWYFASTATGDKLMDRVGSEEVDAAFA